ncbi:MAG TPA: MerR family transcriptional regulator [Acidimicrobiales bacterium]|nr:MerR family transcriptional regulator [Acidimicrobiales bacterium]
MARPRSALSPLAGDDGSRRLTIDELARAAGTTTRQVRAFQTQGLLPHPDLVGRTGYYDRDHLDRLRAILRLQAHGFSLAALTSLLRAWEANLTLGEVLGLRPPVEPVTEDDVDVFGDLDRRIGGRFAPRAPVLSLVPSTILDEAAAS